MWVDGILPSSVRINVIRGRTVKMIKSTPFHTRDCLQFLVIASIAKPTYFAQATMVQQELKCAAVTAWSTR